MKYVKLYEGFINETQNEQYYIYNNMKGKYVISNDKKKIDSYTDKESEATKFEKSETTSIRPFSNSDLFDLVKAKNESILAENEPLGNLGLLHKDAGYKRQADWQNANAKTLIEPGDYVKIAFMEGSEVEWMWVYIEKAIDHDNFEGKLANDPILVHDVKIDDKVTVKRSQIAQLMKKEN